MKLSIATDFMGSNGSPEIPLRHIAESGFTHLHWCHEWNTTYMYSDRELARLARLLSDLNLKLLDIHGSDGYTSIGWCALEEDARNRGVELVLNRIRMFKMLGGEGALMMHLPCCQEGMDEEQRRMIFTRTDALRRSLDELVPQCQAMGARIALENFGGDTFEILSAMFNEYPKEVVGLCYDSGHANINYNNKPAHGIEHLEEHLDRLMALHLHDNDGSGDQHRYPLHGTVNWHRLMGDLAKSAYDRVISFEMSKPREEDPATWLAEAHRRCSEVAGYAVAQGWRGEI